MSQRHHIKFSDVNWNLVTVLRWYDQFEDTRMLVQKVRRSCEQQSVVSVSRSSFEKILDALVAYTRDDGNDYEMATKIWTSLQDQVRDVHPELHQLVQDRWMEVR